tara:strand:- start:4501 stop:4770 length:270 start_codon:yes stop_codon:yes gene_type:complete
MKTNKETFSLRDNTTYTTIASNLSYDEAAARRDSKEPVASHNYTNSYQYEILSDQYTCDNCYHEKDFPHYTCTIKYDFTRVCDYCHHQI